MICHWISPQKRRINGDNAAKSKQDEQCENMLNTHCICHWLVLVCSDTGDILKFVKDFELTTLQLKTHQSL